LWVAGRKIIQTAHLVPFPGEGIGKFGTQKSGCAGNEKIHLRLNERDGMPAISSILTLKYPTV
jgi:hypothetical protein